MFLKSKLQFSLKFVGKLYRISATVRSATTNVASNFVVVTATGGTVLIAELANNTGQAMNSFDLNATARQLLLDCTCTCTTNCSIRVLINDTV